MLTVAVLLNAHCVAGARPVHHSQAAEDSLVVLTRQYSEIVRRYGDANVPDAVSEIALWNTDDVRRAVQRFTGIIHALKRLFNEPAALELKQRMGADRARYDSDRAELIRKLERVYDAIYTGDVREQQRSRGARHDASEFAQGAAGVREALATQSWREGLPERVAGYLRAAVGLHTARAAESWRRGRTEPVVENIEFGAAYFPDLLLSLDTTYGSIWCRVSGILLLASDRHAAALLHYARSLTWYPRDPWLLLGRGSTLESAAMLMSGLPGSATLFDWPERLRPVSLQMEQAITDYETALQQAPDLAEARIRLARVRLTIGDVRGAARELAAASEVPMASIPAYWTALFLGAVEEAAKEPQQAAGHYRRALALYPKSQAAALALSHVLAERLDARSEAVAVVREQIVPTSTRRFNNDPWRLYRMGQAWRVGEWLDEIRRRSQR